jgi:colicin import membrane protein
MAIERESDGIGELAEDMLRMAILIGTRLAQRRVQQRAERLEHAARQSHEARAREARIQDLARQAAVADLSRVSSSAWWDHADARDIRAAWTTAREWQGEDPRAQDAVYRIGDELHSRYGVDVRQTDPDVLGQQPAIPARTTLSVDELVAYDRLLHERIERLAERRAQLAGEDATAPGPAADPRLASLDHETAELGELRALIADELATGPQETAPTPAQGAQEHRELAQAELRTGTAAVGIPAAVAGAKAAQAVYDSHERRERLRERLESAGLPDQAVEARVLADVAQGAPAIEATMGRGPAAHARPTSRNPRGRAPSRRRQR